FVMRKLVAWVAIFLSVLWPSFQPLQASFSGTDLILPAVGRVDGVGGSHFYTTIWVSNPTAQSADFELAFLRTGQSNASPATFHDSVAPGATKAYENAAETLFGVTNGLGAVRLRSSRALLVSSRIY